MNKANVCGRPSSESLRTLKTYAGSRRMRRMRFSSSTRRYAGTVHSTFHIKIHRLPVPCASSASDRGSASACHASVIPWLLSVGAEPLNCKLQVEEFENNRGRGLVSRDAAQPGEMLLSIPFTHVFMEEEEDSEMHWSSAMALRLLRILKTADAAERHELADWAMSLPARIDTPPIQFSDGELQACKDLDTLEEAVSMRALHAQLLESLTGELSSLGYGEEEYSWAVSVLHSRCFCLQQNSLHIAVPGIDMANHSFQPNARVQVTNSPEACQGLSAIEDVCEPPPPAPSRFELVAGDDGIRAGEEVTISYGSWPNDLFYLLFGFVPDENPHDSVVLFKNVDDTVAFIDEITSNTDGSMQELQEVQEVQDLRRNFNRVVVTLQGFDERLFPGVETLLQARSAEDTISAGVVVVERCRQLLAGLAASDDAAIAETGDIEVSENLRTSMRYKLAKTAVLENALTAMGVTS